VPSCVAGRGNSRGHPRRRWPLSTVRRSVPLASEWADGIVCQFEDLVTRVMASRFKGSEREQLVY